MERRMYKIWIRLIMMTVLLIFTGKTRVLADGAGIEADFKEHMVLQTKTKFFLNLSELCENGNKIFVMKTDHEDIGTGEICGNPDSKYFDGETCINIWGEKPGTVTYTLTLAKKKKSKKRITKAFTVTYYSFENPFTEAKLDSINLKKEIEEAPAFALSNKAYKRIWKKKRVKLSFKTKTNWKLVSVTYLTWNDKKQEVEYKPVKYNKKIKSDIFKLHQVIIKTKNIKNGHIQLIRLM